MTVVGIRHGSRDAEPVQGGVAVVLAAVENEAGRQVGLGRARTALKHDNSIGIKARNESLEQRADLTVAVVVRRVKEDDVPELARPGHISEGRGSVNVDRDRRALRGSVQDVGRILATNIRRASVVVDERNGCGTSRRGLEPKSTGTGIQVKNSGTAKNVARLQRREDRLTNSIARGTGARRGNGEGKGSRKPTDDASHASTMAHRLPHNGRMPHVESVDGATLPIDQVADLYSAVGWSAYTNDLDSLARALAGSSTVVIARDDSDPNELVGLARVVSDGAAIAYLQDVLVRPSAQRSGLGRALVEAALEPYKNVRQKVLLTDDEPGQKAFYESLGYRETRDFGEGTLRAFVRFD